MLDRLVESLETCPMVKRGEYNYFIHPITDGVPLVEPALLRDVCSAMIKVLDLNGVDKIVVVEAMGIHIGSVLSVMTDIPMTIMRKRVTSSRRGSGPPEDRLLERGTVPQRSV